MTILLLIIIYIAFIALGVPDSLIGSAWPAIYPDFGVPVGSVSYITLLISGCTVVSSMLSARVLGKFGTAKVTAVSTAMTAVALLGFSFAPSLIFLCLLAIPLGLGAGAIDAGLNNYIALHYHAKHMNFLHCFYGIGVSCSPYLMSLALGSTGWRTGYRYAFAVQMLITLLLLLSFPLWKKQSEEEEEEAAVTEVLTFGQMMRMPTIRWVWAVHLATNAIEYACGTWGSTYLVRSKGFLPEEGAVALTLYYAGMAIGRFLSGLIAERIPTWRRIGIGVGIVAAAVTLLILPLPPAVAVVGLFLVGLGNGSIYPNLIHLTPHNFGRNLSQAVMGSQIAAAYTGVMLAPPLVAVVSGFAGIGIFPVFLAVLFVAMTLSLWRFVRLLKQQNRYETGV